MTKLKLCGLILLATLAMTLRASEQPTAAVAPIGIFVDSVVEEDATAKDAKETDEARATVLRDGKEYPALQGMEVYPGDVVSTPKGGGIMVAFLNSNLVELDESTRLSFGGGSATKDATITLNSGHIGVVSKSVLGDSMDIGLGETNHPHARVARVAGPKPAKLEIITRSNGAGGGFTTTVACTAGSAILTPIDGQTVKIADGIAPTVNLVTVHTAVANVTNAPVTITTGNVDKTTLKGLKVGALQDILVSVGKNNLVTFKATIVNGDGSITKGSVTTTAGVVTKDAWKTSEKLTKYSASWSESTKNGVTSISAKQTFQGDTFSAKFVANQSPKASLKVGKITYAGAATYDPATGKITFTGAPKKPDGTTATFTFDPNGANGQTQTVVVTTNNVAGTPIVHSTPYGSPGATTPDPNGRLIGQNSPPVSQ